MENTMNFTQEELQLIYAACMSYGDKLAEIKKTIPNEDEIIFDRLADRAKDCWNLVKKVSGCMQNHKDQVQRR
ncbi:MAG: hypothetical protein K2P69_14040 [Eubacterium sp.]|nr:hypothetical protein [Eubacterium sp.]